jgi:prepilin signal peptidase PulO-like enzyme (type II secretory pathway)
MLLITLFLALVGAILGSFICCQVRRTRERTTRHKTRGSRSECPHCSHQLKPLDLIPIISWLCLKGRCRYCKNPIGYTEILTELATATIFVVITLAFPLALGGSIQATICSGSSAIPSGDPITLTLYYTLLTLFLVLTSALIYLALYDLKYHELPTRVLVFSIVCALVYSIAVYAYRIFIAKNTPATAHLQWSIFGGLIYPTELSLAGALDVLANLSGAILILPALYFALYKFSHERWVGSGDWLLALACALLLGDFIAALLALLAANLLGCLVAIPLLARAKTKHPATRLQKSPRPSLHLPLAPLLITGTYLIYLWGIPLRAWLGI